MSVYHSITRIRIEFDVLLDPLARNNTLPILFINFRLLLSQIIERVRPRDSTEQQPNHPKSIRLLLQSLRSRTLFNSRSIQIRQRIQRHVSRISQLSANSTVLSNWVEVFRISHNGRGFEMLYEFPELYCDLSVLTFEERGDTDSHCFAHKSKLLLDSLEGRNLARRAICAE